MKHTMYAILLVSFVTVAAAGEAPRSKDPDPAQGTKLKN